MKIDAKKIFYALLGIFLIGIGIAFNSCAKLGNDPVGIVYDGVRNIAKLNSEQLGTASNFVNYGLIVLLIFIGRRYINIGTFIYILPYGLFVNLGTKLYYYLFSSNLNNIYFQSLAVVVGCLLLYTGVAIFIVVDIGLDPFTGVVMVIRDKIKWDYKRTKIMFDVTMVIIGTILGGKLGVVTIVTALIAGPTIQFLANQIKAIFVERKV
ncbi:YczE/YyaS/YitT family protein [Anaerocolumna xylanovorans]|uniref:Uncharacterized membrane protein YczE n=1 Tax=Anaerocolumna xylanovorans DSM 12503 TaxID=1121345 RepID=A0A1M7XW41_9FIRM|nr:hypothetical protein [Anaerocolumna xylanovorans]SHO42937.1 Uncharacterized membrane protein YczE [Anaerocolumna xylanovorans DSM 12503]